MAVGAEDHEVLDVRAVELDRPVDEIVDAHRAVGHPKSHGPRHARGFTVDDAHLFCTPEQIAREIDDCVDFAYQVLKTFGFDKITFELSVKGSDTNKLFLGTAEEWEKVPKDASIKRALLKGSGV